MRAVARVRRALEGRHRSGQPFRFRHGWIPIAGPHAMREERTIREAYEYHDDSTGFHTRVKSITDHGDGNPVEVSLTIHDRNGNQIGDVSRIVEADGHTVHHDALILLPEFQGQGFATRFNQHAENAYRANGIDRIELYANVDVGGFAWARAGYDFRSGRERDRVAHRAEQMMAQFNPDVQARIRTILDDPNFTPLQMAMVGWQQGATLWAGKRIMLGAGWHGVKKL